MKKLIFIVSCVMALVVGCDSPTEIKKDTVITGNDVYGFNGNVNEAVYVATLFSGESISDTLFSKTNRSIPSYATIYDSIRVYGQNMEIRAYKGGGSTIISPQTTAKYGISKFRVTQVIIYTE